MQIFRALQQVFHIGVVPPAVCLHAQGMYCRALAKVQHAALQERGVCRYAHYAAQGVYLAHKVALGRAADRGVAGQVCHAVQRKGEQRRARAQLRRRHRGLYARVPCAHHNHIIISQPVHGLSLRSICALCRRACTPASPSRISAREKSACSSAASSQF